MLCNCLCPVSLPRVIVGWSLIFDCNIFWPRGYKTFFMLISTEHEISTAHNKLKYRQMKKFLALSFSDVVFIMLINVKMPTIVGILTFMSRMNFVLS